MCVELPGAEGRRNQAGTWEGLAVTGPSPWRDVSGEGRQVILHWAPQQTVGLGHRGSCQGDSCGYEVPPIITHLSTMLGDGQW